LLSLPTIAGAGFLKTHDLIKDGDLALGSDAALVALLSGLMAFLAMRAMMAWLARANFNIFVYYRLILGAVLLWAIQNQLIA
jgi:undecaprenyl pyrophosphate phosphatase UppP